MSKIDASFWVAFVLYHGPWGRRFCGVHRAIANRCRMLSKNPPKNSPYHAFRKAAVSFVGWYKVKDLANNDFRQKRIRRLIGQLSQ